jgi:hypothetical protein
MVLTLLEFNRYYHFYSWLVERKPRWWERNRRPIWGQAVTGWEMWQPPITIHRDGVVINPKDYPTQPPLNRKCHEGNIHPTILVEYDTLWPDGDYLELYFRVYHSISNRILQKIIRKGLEEAKNKLYEEENIVQAIASYLPSGLPVDADGMKTMANELVDRRWKKRLEEEAELQKEKDVIELS